MNINRNSRLFLPSKNPFKKAVFYFSVALCCLQVTSLQCQEYMTLPDSNATWIVKSEAMSVGYYEYGLKPYDDDTIILNNTYNKIFLFDLSDGIDEYSGAYRYESDGKVYYVPTGTVDTVEYLWYDFSKNVGDTVWDVALNEFGAFLGTYNLIVDSTEILFAGPHSVKCLYLHAISPGPPGYNGNPLVWTEKIGSLNGGIFNMYECGLFNTTLHCMDIHDTLFYYAPNQNCFFGEPVSLTYQYGDCEIPVWIHENSKRNYELKIHPVPILNNFKISTIPNSEMSICIYNEVGEMVYKTLIHTQANEFEYELECPIVSGLYILTVQFDNKFYSSKIIKR